MNGHETLPTPRSYAEHILNESETIINDALEIAYPEHTDLDPVMAFPKPTEVRAESPDIPELTEGKRAALIQKAGELGFGKAEDVTLSEQGLVGATVILEGGQPHKMLAEALMVVDDYDANPKAIIFSASPHRKLSNAAEIASAERLFGHVSKTEYDVALDVAHALPGFSPDAEPRVLEAAYDIGNGFSTSAEPSGQFQSIGKINGIPVVLMQINRRELGGGKYDSQPGTADVIGIVDRVSRSLGDDTSPLVHVTSGTYRPSRAVGVALAGLSVDRLVGIATYGNDRLNQIKGETSAVPVNQLPGELHELAVQSNRLREALS